jgi:hypothetical protein
MNCQKGFCCLLKWEALTADSSDKNGKAIEDNEFGKSIRHFFM